MTNQRFIFWQKWLTYANIMTIFVGLLCAFASNSIFFELHNSYSKEVFFETKEFTPEVLNMKNWLFGIIGGTIVGFHTLMVLISEFAFKKKEKWSYWAMWMGMLSWFIIDSSISIYYGAIHNVILINIFVLIIIGLPLIATNKEFK
jgi:multisubunit Na+/H+ antiporter MnhB subunit